MSQNKFRPVFFKIPFYLIFLLAPAAMVSAQDKAVTASAQNNPISATNQRFYQGMKYLILSSAERMPEKDYSFKPTDAVRSYGQILGHVADEEYGFCSIVLGEKIRRRESRKPKPRKPI